MDISSSSEKMNRSAFAGRALGFARRIRAGLAADVSSRHLVWSLLRRRIEARFRGSVFGVLWVILLPLALLAVYTLVFNHFLKVRWPGLESATGLETALNIYLGLLVLNYFAENISGAPQLIQEHAQFVKKIVFPLPVLGYVAALAGLAPLLFGLVIAFLLSFAATGTHPLYLLALPLLWLPLLLWGVGLQWWLGALGVFVRDIAHVASPAVTLLLFLSPVFYSVGTLPAPWNDWLQFNPLTLPIESARQLLFVGQWPESGSLMLTWLAALVFALSGRWVFARLQPGFSDVL